MIMDEDDMSLATMDDDEEEETNSLHGDGDGEESAEDLTSLLDSTGSDVFHSRERYERPNVRCMYFFLFFKYFVRKYDRFCIIPTLLYSTLPTGSDVFHTPRKLR